MKKPKNVLALVFSAIIVFFIIPLIVNALFRPEISIDFFAVSWEAGDALAYVAGSLAFIGTMFLGWVAWKQNADLQKIERNHFIAQNSCMALIKEIKLQGFYGIPVNLDRHDEQIVKSKVETDPLIDYSGLDCKIQLKRLGNFPATVHVDKLVFRIEKNQEERQNSLFIFTKSFDSHFSQIAICEDFDTFKVTILITRQEKQAILDAIKTDCHIFLDMKLDLVTANFVATHIKCQATLDKFTGEIAQNTSIVFKSTNVPPLCFWLGNTIMEEQDITFRYSEK